MNDIAWISQEAHKIHDWFQTLFFLLVTVFLLLGVLVEYFKIPLGNTPSFGPLVGRVLIAAILLYSYPETANMIRNITTALSEKLGDLSAFRLALDKMGQKVDELSWSWTSVRQSVIVGISFLSFFLLYLSVHVAQALYLYTSVLLYVFSPILIALFVLPQTAPATSALYRSLIEVSLWKPVWCVIATLVWSTGISDIQGAGSNVSFLSAICFSLIAAGSLLATPMVVHALAGSGLSSMAQNVSTIGVPGVGTLTPIKTAYSAWNTTGRIANAGIAGTELATRNMTKVNTVIKRIPRFNVPQGKPIFVKPETGKEGKSL